MNCLSVFDHFLGLALKGLSHKNPQILNKVKYLQDQLQLLTESKQEKCYRHLSKKTKADGSIHY